MKSVCLCAAVGAALLLVGCVNTAPPVPAPTPVSYLSLLDGHAIHPIDGEKVVPIHPVSPFTASATEIIEIRIAQETVNFKRSLTASASLAPSGAAFLMTLRILTDKRSIEPEEYAQASDYLKKPSSAAGMAVEIVVSPLGKALSRNASGGGARPDTSPDDLFMLLVDRGKNLHQGEVINRDDVSAHAAFKLRLTVQGRGLYQGRPVIVLSIDVKDEAPDGPTQATGFMFLDEAIGIASYTEVNTYSQSTFKGETVRTVSNLKTSADLAGAGQSL